MLRAFGGRPGLAVVVLRRDARGALSSWYKDVGKDLPGSPLDNVGARAQRECTNWRADRDAMAHYIAAGGDSPAPLARTAERVPLFYLWELNHLVA